MTDRLRLYSALVLFVFVLMHLLNHAAGIVSLSVMEAWRTWTIDPWRTGPGTGLLVLAAILHAGAALAGMVTRRTLRRLPRWQVVQMILGLLIPFTLAAHVIGTRGLHEV